MFRYKSLFSKVSKFSKYKFEGELNPSHHALSLNYNYSKNYFYNPTEFDGFHKLFSLKQKVLEIRSLEKFMSKFSDVKCWNCKQYLELINFSCKVCGALQYPKDKTNFFELLGVSQTYNINQEDLSTKFKNLQMKFHPDKFANRTKEEMEISEIYSRLINKAYTTLKHPVSRGFYMLELQKISRDSHLPLEQEFLTAIMEKNEELDAIENVCQLQKFLNYNNDVIEKETSLIGNAFNSNKLDDAKIHLLKLNYYINLNHKIKEKQNNLIIKTTP